MTKPRPGTLVVAGLVVCLLIGIFRAMVGKELNLW